VTFLIEIDSERAAELRPGSDAIEGRWWSLDGFPATAFDHELALRDTIARIVATTPGVRRTAEFVGGAFLYRVLCSRCCPGLALHPIADGRGPAEAETAYNDHVILHDLEREAAQ
jgi:hypothetical protein